VHHRLRARLYGATRRKNTMFALLSSTASGCRQSAARKVAVARTRAPRVHRRSRTQRRAHDDEMTKATPQGGPLSKEIIRRAIVTARILHESILASIDRTRSSGQLRCYRRRALGASRACGRIIEVIINRSNVRYLLCKYRLIRLVTSRAVTLIARSRDEQRGEDARRSTYR